MSTPKTGPGFHHVAIRAYDFEKTLAFYKEALGYERVYGWGTSPKRIALLGIGDGNYTEVLEGRPADEIIPEGAILHYAVRVADADAAYARAIAGGAVSVSAPRTLDLDGDRVVTIRIAFVKGLDGEVIEFFQNDEL
jgi:glyoxylase I family protein